MLVLLFLLSTTVVALLTTCLQLRKRGNANDEEAYVPLLKKDIQKNPKKLSKPDAKKKSSPKPTSDSSKQTNPNRSDAQKAPVEENATASSVTSMSAPPLNNTQDDEVKEELGNIQLVPRKPKLNNPPDKTSSVESSVMPGFVVPPSDQLSSNSDQISSTIPILPTECQTSTPIYTQQPGLSKIHEGPAWMPAPEIIPGVTPGLEYLAALDGIILQQIKKRRFRGSSVILNQSGQKVFNAAGRRRLPFEMKIEDAMNRPVIIARGPDEDNDKFGIFGKFYVECPPGQMIGRVVEQPPSCCSNSEFHILVTEKITFKITQKSCCDFAKYGIINDTGLDIGSITWNERFQKAHIEIKFPMNLDVHSKALLLGALLFFDYHHIKQRERHLRYAASNPPLMIS